MPLEGKFLLIALVIVRVTFKCDRASHGPKCPLNNDVSIFKKTCCSTLKHFDNVFATGGNNIVEVFESLTTSFLKLTFKWHKMTSNYDVHSGQSTIQNVNIGFISRQVCLSEEMKHNVNIDFISSQLCPSEEMKHNVIIDFISSQL